jgi:hypothetical protein
MTEVVSQLLKINLRMRSKENIGRLLCDVLGGSAGHDRGSETIGEFDQTQAQLQKHGIEFSRLTEFHGNKVAFVHPRDACGIALEFIQGPLVDKTGS